MSQYKDELLSSCLQLVLSAPKEFINIPQFIPSLQMAFKLGLSHIPVLLLLFIYLPLTVHVQMANIGLAAVEHWRKVKKEELTKHLPLILPFLNDYLLMAPQEEEFEDEVTGSEVGLPSLPRRSSKNIVNINDVENRTSIESRPPSCQVWR